MLYKQAVDSIEDSNELYDYVENSLALGDNESVCWIDHIGEGVLLAHVWSKIDKDNYRYKYAHTLSVPVI